MLASPVVSNRCFVNPRLIANKLGKPALVGLIAPALLSSQKTEYSPSQDVKAVFHRPDW